MRASEVHDKEREGPTDVEDQLEGDPPRTQDGGEARRRPCRDRRGDQGPLKPATRQSTRRQRALDWRHQGRPELLPGFQLWTTTSAEQTRGWRCCFEAEATASASRPVTVATDEKRHSRLHERQ